MNKHPLQKIKDHRFVANPIVQFLLDNGPYDMNDLAMMDFSNEDREHFAQLIGYSLSGFSELSYVSNEAVDAAYAICEREMTEEEARIATLQETLNNVKEHVAQAASVMFNIHPDDFDNNW